MRWTWLNDMISNHPSRSLCRTSDIDDRTPYPYAHVYQIDNNSWAAVWDDGNVIGTFDHKGEAMDTAFDAAQVDINES